MTLRSKTAVTAAVMVIAIGGGAAAASAYSISGGTYVGVPSAGQTFTIGGAYSYDCPASQASFLGTATGADTSSFTPAYGACTFFGFPLTVLQSGTWSLRVIGGPDAGGYYDGELGIPSATVTTVQFPIGGCTITVSGPQTFTHGTGVNVIRMRNTGTGVELEASVSGIAHSDSGCAHPTGSDGVYDTNGPISIPGITIS